MPMKKRINCLLICRYKLRYVDAPQNAILAVFSEAKVHVIVQFLYGEIREINASPVWKMVGLLV